VKIGEVKVGEDTAEERINYLKDVFLRALDPGERRMIYCAFLFQDDYEQWEIDGALVSIGCDARSMKFFDGHLGRDCGGCA